MPPVMQLTIEPAPGEQLTVGALLDDESPGHDHDEIRLSHRRQAAGDGHHGAAPGRREEAREHLGLRAPVQGRGRRSRGSAALSVAVAGERGGEGRRFLSGQGATST